MDITTSIRHAISGRGMFLVIAATIALSACSGGKEAVDTADTDEPAVTQENLYDIARDGNNAQFDISWDLAAKKDVNLPDPRTGQSLIHYAAENRASPLMIHAVLMKGADPNLKDKAGLTPLRHAIIKDNPVAIRNLMVRSQEAVSSGRVQSRPDMIQVRTDIQGPDGRTDLEICQGILAGGMQHRGCAAMTEILAGGNFQSASG